MFTLCRSLTALTLSLLLAFSPAVYAQSSKHTPASPPSHIHFAGVSHHLLSEETKEFFNYGVWHYRSTLQPTQSLRHQLKLVWDSDEWISDTHDEKSCPNLKDEPIFLHLRGGPYHIVIYRACDELYELKVDGEYRKDVYIHVDNQLKEILLSYITAGSDDLGQFSKLTISRYIPVPIPHYDYINGMLHYAYTITAYGPQEQAIASLLGKLNEEGEQWLQAVSSAPVPSFILDRANYYENCKTHYGDKADDECPW